MERVTSLLEALKSELTWYANTEGYQSTAHLFCDEKAHKYAVITLDDALTNDRAFVMMMAHIDGDIIVIDADYTDKPLYEALMHAGIPREKIILAYAGEQVPTPTS
jgi:hypothetical protein